MANKKIGEAGEDLLIVGGMIAGYFLVLKPLIDVFSEDPQDKADIEQQETTIPSQNIFSFQYQPFVDNFNANPSYDANGNVLTMQQYWQIIKANNDAGNPTLLGSFSNSGVNTPVNIAQLGDDLMSALSPWVLATDSNNVFAVFSALQDRTQLAALSAYIYYNYGADLLAKLKGSVFKVGLSPGDLATLIKQMNALPF